MSELRIVPCGCGDRICKKVFIRGGIFHTEGRFEREDAEALVKKLEVHDELVNILRRLVAPFDGAKAAGFDLPKTIINANSEMLADIRAALAKVSS